MSLNGSGVRNFFLLYRLIIAGREYVFILQRDRIARRVSCLSLYSMMSGIRYLRQVSSFMSLKLIPEHNTRSYYL